jgi:hypothetical protein
MSDPLRTDSQRQDDARPDADREGKVERLLLDGLEFYFAGRYDQAINVWTRVLFFDRAHARARAYIERARSAQAEHQRESEELLEHGVAAFDRGDSVEARRLLESALAQGAPSDQALAALDRLTRLEQGAPVPGDMDRGATSTGARLPLPQVRRTSRAAWALFTVLTVIILGAGAFAAGAFRTEWPSLLRREGPPSQAPHQVDTALPMPRRAELTLARARSLVTTGRLRDGLALLDQIASTDPLRPEADRFKAQVQRQLITLAAAPVDPSARVEGRTP